MPERLITVAEFNEPTEAQLARNRLEGAEIECFIEDEFVPFIPAGGIKLKVLLSEARRAIEVLKEKRDLETIPEVKGPRCPKCNSASVYYARIMTRRFDSLGDFLAKVLLDTINSLFKISFVWIFIEIIIEIITDPRKMLDFLPPKKWQCKKCGHEWENKP